MRLDRLVVLFALPVVPVACGGDDDAATTSQTTEIVVSGEIDVELGETSIIFPEGYPVDDVPVPAHVVVAAAEVLSGETTDLYEITGWYDGDPIRAARDYLAVLDDLGYEVTSRTEAPESLFFTADDGDWFVSAGFFPDPVRNEGTSVGLTVGPAAAMTASG